MASDLNKVILIGRLTRDPETTAVNSGSVTKFSIANNKTWKDSDGNPKEQVSFFNCESWGKGGEIIAQYMTKGNQIQITGRLKQQTWDDKESGKKRSSVEIVVENFQFLGGKNDNSSDNGSNVSNEPTPFGDLPNF